MGLAVWNEDEAGPYQAIPQPGESWQPVMQPKRYPHEYVRKGTAKLLTLLHPATGEVRLKGVTNATNAVLHPWLKEQLSAILEQLPAPPDTLSPEENRMQWESWQEGLTKKLALPDELPRLRMLLILDNLSGHRSTGLTTWFIEHGVMPLYTPIGGSWLNMAESLQRIVVSRALSGQSPDSPEQIINWLETAGKAWNREPTPFIWGGKRKERRNRARLRHALAGSSAYSLFPIKRTHTYAFADLHPI
jgi:hypothetical protein